MVVFSVSFFLNANVQYKSIDREEQQIAIIKMKPNCQNKVLLGVNWAWYKSLFNTLDFHSSIAVLFTNVAWNMIM